LRFAVHRPGSPVASPRSHRMPCGDVPGRVHVRVAGEIAGDAGEEGLALAALRCDMLARRATLARVRGTDLLHPARGLILQATYQQAPRRSENAPVQAGFLSDSTARLFESSLSRSRHASDVEVLHADQVEPARQVGAGLLRPILANVGLAGFYLCDGQLDPGPTGRAALSSCQLALQTASRRCRGLPGRGTVSVSPVDSAALTVMPRSMPTTFPAPGPAMGAGRAAKARCQRPARSRVTLYDFAAGTARDQRNRTHPTLGIHNSPTWRLRRRTCPGFTATTRNPSFRPAFRHVGLRCVPEKKLAIAWEKSRRACCCTIWLPARSQSCSARLSKLPALVQVARRLLSAGPPPQLLLHRKVPDEPCMGAVIPQRHLLAGHGEQAVP